MSWIHGGRTDGHVRLWDAIPFKIDPSRLGSFYESLNARVVDYGDD
jgi:hypothetical protein